MSKKKKNDKDSIKRNKIQINYFGNDKCRLYV